MTARTKKKKKEADEPWSFEPFHSFVFVFPSFVLHLLLMLLYKRGRSVQRPRARHAGPTCPVDTWRFVIRRVQCTWVIRVFNYPLKKIRVLNSWDASRGNNHVLTLFFFSFLFWVKKRYTRSPQTPQLLFISTFIFMNWNNFTELSKNAIKLINNLIKYFIFN